MSELTTAPAALDELADLVLEIAGDPIDAWAVAATLESRGLRDRDAVARYGCADVFDLAERVLVRCRARAQVQAATTPEIDLRRARFARMAAHVGRGGFFFVPMALQVVALTLFGYSSWASVHFSTEQATTVALAVGASFITTGGFIQALGYLAPGFLQTGKGVLAERLVWGWTVLGLVCGLAVGGALVGVEALVGGYPSDLVEVGAAYFALLSAVWLATGALYVLHAYVAMLVAVVAGLGTVIILREGADAGIYAAQWGGLGATVAVSVAWAAVALRRRARATADDLRLARFPPRRQLARAAAPHFCFGALYFALVLSDRLVAWTDGAHPLAVWFAVDYEIGLDLALIAAVPALAYLEHTVEAFSARLEPAQQRHRATQIGAHNRDALGFYGRQLAAVVAIALASVAVVAVVVFVLIGADGFGTLRPYLEGDVSPRVFAWGAFGYGLLACGLLNAALLFALARPWPVVRALALAVVVDLAVGLALSRGGEPWEAVVGLAAGCAVFAGLTGAAIVRTLRHADYHAVAAY